MKTFTKEDITKARDLKEYMLKAGYKRIPQGFDSVFIHLGEAAECNISVAVEAYDYNFDKVTSTPLRRDQFVERVHKYLLKLFPKDTIEVTWYSGFEHHKWFILR